MTLEAWHEHQEAHNRTSLLNESRSKMRKLNGSAFKRWYDKREREVINQAIEIMRETEFLPTSAFPEFSYYLRARHAANVLVAFNDLATRVQDKTHEMH
jgi:hypothetical protein